MTAQIEIRDAETDQTLEVLGKLTYENAGIAIQNCEQWYADELKKWEDKNYAAEIVLVETK